MNTRRHPYKPCKAGPYLAELSLGVDEDLAHLALEALAGHAHAALGGQPLALAGGAGRHRLAPAARLHGLAVQHQLVLGAWERSEVRGQRGSRYCW